MPAAMESSQNIENPLEFFIFLQISSKMFFFLEISEILPGSRESAPRSRRPGSGSLGPAEILRISQPRKSVSGAPPTVKNFIGGMQAFEVADSGCS